MGKLGKKADAKTGRHLAEKGVPEYATSPGAIIERKRAARASASPAAVFVKVPRSAMPFVKQVLDAVKSGKRVSVITVEKEVSTIQAAEILNVSRPYLTRLLDDGQIPFHRVGSHRRVRLDDLLRYKEQNKRARLKTLEKLVAVGQELELD